MVPDVVQNGKLQGADLLDGLVRRIEVLLTDPGPGTLGKDACGPETIYSWGGAAYNRLSPNQWGSAYEAYDEVKRLSSSYRTSCGFERIRAVHLRHAQRGPRVRFPLQKSHLGGLPPPSQDPRTRGGRTVAVMTVETNDPHPVQDLDPANKPVEQVGPLQLRVLHYIWKHGPSTVQTVMSALNGESGSRPLAYTTFLTVMRNLARRNLLEQKKTTQRSHLFSPAVGEDELAIHPPGQPRLLPATISTRC